MMLCRANFVVSSLVLLHRFKRLLTVCILLIRSQLFATVFVPFRLVNSFCLTSTHGKLLIRCFFPFWSCYLVRWPYSIYFTHFVYWNGLYFESLKGNTLARMTNLSHRRACRGKKRELIDSKMLVINNSPETLCTSS